LRGDGVAGVELVGCIRNGAGAGFGLGLADESVARRSEADSGVVGPPNSPLYSPYSAESMTDANGSVYAKFKVREYLSEIQGVLGCEEWVDTHAAMYATLDALRDAEALKSRADFLQRIAVGLPPHIDVECALNGVFTVLLPKISKGELEDFTPLLPKDMKNYHSPHL
jgi:uncharacterized protein (DUF2267 family)